MLALYAQQGALPRAVGRYSTRSVPWVAIVMLALFSLIGVYWKNTEFVIAVLTEWSSTLYLVIAVFYLGMHFNKKLEKPVKARFGVPIAIFIVCFTIMMTIATLILNWRAGVTWFIVVALFILYDQYVVPRTQRGGFYREQVLRRRTSATRL